MHLLRRLNVLSTWGYRIKHKKTAWITGNVLLFVTGIISFCEGSPNNSQGVPSPLTSNRSSDTIGTNIGIFTFENYTDESRISKLESLAHQEKIAIFHYNDLNKSKEYDFNKLNGAIVSGICSEYFLGKMYVFVKKGGRIVIFYEPQNIENNYLLKKLFNLTIEIEWIMYEGKKYFFFPNVVFPNWLRLQGIHVGFEEKDKNCSIGCYLDYQGTFWKGSMKSEETGKDRIVSVEMKIGNGWILFLPSLQNSPTLYDDCRFEQFENKEFSRRILNWLAGRSQITTPADKQSSSSQTTTQPARILNIFQVCEAFSRKPWNAFKEEYATLKDDWYLMSGKLELIDLGEFKMYGIKNNGCCLVLGQDNNMEYGFSGVEKYVGQEIVVGARGFGKGCFMSPSLLEKMTQEGFSVHDDNVLILSRLAIYGIKPHEKICTLDEYQDFKNRAEASSLMNHCKP